MRSLPYALALIVGGLVGWKLERLVARHRFARVLRKVERMDQEPYDYDAPVPYRIRNVYTPDQWHDDAPGPTLPVRFAEPYAHPFPVGSHSGLVLWPDEGAIKS